MMCKTTFGQSGKAALKITGSPLKLSCWLSALNMVMDELQELVALAVIKTGFVMTPKILR